MRSAIDQGLQVLALPRVVFGRFSCCPSTLPVVSKSPWRSRSRLPSLAVIDDHLLNMAHIT